MTHAPAAPARHIGPAGQWRLAEVQLANWGTFDGAIYRIPIAREGHLITGPSGSGKSSLLDAISAVLTPDHWLRFNTAAQGATTRDDRRNLMSYVRGAWNRASDEYEDRVVSQYLRQRATWGGILLRYDNGVDDPTTLVRLFFAKGTSTQSADLASIFMIERSPLDLRELEPFAAKGLETRKIQAQWPGALVTTTGSHRAFYARMRKIFGIANDSALQLLHKTQSAKSLDSLDQLFRDYMLDRPRTFDIADNATEQFGELNDAHEHVVQLRMQRDHLEQLQVQSEAYDAALDAARSANELADAVLPYQRGRRRDLAQAELVRVDEDIQALIPGIEHASRHVKQAREALDVARQREQQLTGGGVDQLRLRIDAAREDVDRTAKRWQNLSTQLAKVGINHAPETAAEFAELLAQLDQRANGSLPAGASYVQQQLLADAKRNLAQVGAEIETLRRSGTSVPAALLEIRAQIERAIGATPGALPFTAELIEVRQEYAEWTGAIERVLRSIALTMLVPEHHLAEVRRWVNAHRIPGRLRFEVVGEPAPPQPAASDVSLVNRVAVAEHPYAAWLAGVLSTRFDYACVDSPDDFDRHARAITKEGQLKQSATRYEKDDRHDISDQRYWVLGDREAKHEALITHLHRAEAEVKAAEAIVDRAEAAKTQAMVQNATVAAIRSQDWRDLDRGSAESSLRNLEQQLDALTRTNSDASAAVAAVTAARNVVATADEQFEQLRVELSDRQRQQRELTREIDDMDAQFVSTGAPSLSEHVMDELERRFRASQRLITRSNIGDIGAEVANALRRELDAANRDAAQSSGHLVNLATEFKGRWPAAAADLAPAVEDRQGYLELLGTIATHRLPDHESRFLKLLRERSRDMVGDLRSEILAAPDEVRDRIVPVNSSLRKSPFDRDRFLSIRVKTNRPSAAKEFLDDLRAIAEGGWEDDDAETAETRFRTLARIMRRLESSDHVDRQWKNQCLDTRLHVTFLADEIDEDERVHATFDSAGALSGGQQQKLAVFCLAAALRYQLADADDAHTKYGTVVLDEAFDKADARFTRMALDVFTEFGFHLVLATPHKLLQTLEPYIGGVTVVENPTRRKSEFADVTWERR
ncbi:ATP-binding protein [Gulosibacter sediminis]|uniref:ATP-binding protein n=1 Tax=Gulosibacter sediminis TaxID=1729695 RepID=UPI0024A7DDEF|nr:SbcC/MukB-like Walker B domain-containing protein [Gulosibacter sediminis]